MGRPKNMALDKKYTPEANKKRGNRYSTEEKLQCLMVLQANRFSLNKTAELTGVSDVTLKNWLTVYGPELFGNADAAVIEGQTKEMISLIPTFQSQIANDQASFLSLAHEIKLDALKKLQKKIKAGVGINSLVFIIKTLDRATLDGQKIPTNPNDVKTDGAGPRQQINMFQTIHNRFSVSPPDSDTTDE